jgi:hypothetical protein
MAVEDHRMLFVKAEVAELQKVNPKLRFAQAWELVRKKHPDLFGASPGTDSRAGVAASARPGSYFAQMQALGIVNAEAPYIELRAEDAEELERQVAAGLWD